MMKTRDEIESLKKSWLADPCWDIEDTEGFEEFRDELAAFHKEQDEKWEEMRKKKAAKFSRLTGIYDFDQAKVLSTPEDIENKLCDIENNIGEAGTHFELAQLVIAREQVRATMLLMAQVKRIADLLGEKMDRDAGDSNTDFMTRLYKVD